ncbi:MAG: hypothetical protein ABI685_06505 [Ferruginibacter sp.]
MKIKAFILVLLAGGLLLNACQKNIDIFVPDPGQLNGPDTAWQSSITTAMPVSVLKNNLLPEIYQDTIIVNANIATINTAFGVQLNFPPNCCVTGTGQAITGKVEVEIQLAKKKGDMIRLNIPSSYNDTMLITAGEIFIRLKKDGQVAQLAPGIRINIHYVDLPVNTQMKFFVGDETNAERFNWLPNPDPLNNTVVFGSQAYEIYTNHLRWISVAQVYDILNTVPKVNVTADIASYFTNANTTAFTVFKDVRSVIAMHGDLSTRKFTALKLPVGKQITVVVISKQGNDYYLGYESAITATPISGPPNQLVHVVPIKKSLPDILAYLNTL